MNGRVAAVRHNADAKTAWIIEANCKANEEIHDLKRIIDNYKQEKNKLESDKEQQGRHISNLETKIYELRAKNEALARQMQEINRRFIPRTEHSVVPNITGIKEVQRAQI